MAQAEGRPLRFAKEPVANLQSCARRPVSTAKMHSVNRSGYDDNNNNKIGQGCTGGSADCSYLP